MLAYFRKPPSLFLVVIVLFLYLGTSFYVLRTLAKTAGAYGISHLQNGQSDIITDPTQALSDFTNAKDSFQTASSELKGAPLLFRIIAPLPPFRWQVGLLKAHYALAQAGTSASLISASFPILVEPNNYVDFNTLATAASQRYFSWFNERQSDRRSLLDNLDSARQHLSSIPSWALFSQKKQLEVLRNEVAKLQTSVETTEELSRLTQISLGLNDQKVHTWALLVNDGDNLVAYSLIKGQSGTISQAGGQLKIPNSKYQIPNINLQELAGGNVEGTISIDLKTLHSILTETGSLTLPNNTVVNSENLDQHITDPDLISVLVYTLSQPNSLTPSLQTIFKSGFEKGDIKLWSSDSQLNQLFSAKN